MIKLEMFVRINSSNSVTDTGVMYHFSSASFEALCILFFFVLRN